MTNEPVWIVYEANSIIPKVFRSQKAAYKYRDERMSRVRHQVYIQPGEIED